VVKPFLEAASAMKPPAEASANGEPALPPEEAKPALGDGPHPARTQPRRPLATATPEE
jgi:hypothetical protein